MGDYVGLFTPMLLHLSVSEIVAAVMGGQSDSTLRVVISSLLVIPAALWMVWRDQRREEQGSEVGTAQNREVSRRGKRAARERPGTENSRIPRKWAGRMAGALLCLAGGAALNVLWSGALSALGLQEHFSNTTQENLLASQFALQLLGLGVLAPIAEELVFRALTYRRMRRFFGVGMSVGFSALLFAVYHGNVIQMVYAFPMAILLALLCEKGQWAGYPIAFHMGANLMTVAANLL